MAVNHALNGNRAVRIPRHAQSLSLAIERKQLQRQSPNIMRRPPTGIEITVNREISRPIIANGKVKVGDIVTLDGFGFDYGAEFEIMWIGSETVRVRSR